MFCTKIMLNGQKCRNFLMDDLLAFWKSNDFLSKIDGPNNRWIRKFVRENGNNLPEKKVDQICKFINFMKASEIQSIDTDFLSYMFRCSLMTVHRAQKRENDEKNHIEGRKRILSSEENEEIINWISKKTKTLCPPDRNELTQKAQNILEKRGENNILSRNWVDGFLSQNSMRIRKAKARPIEEERNKVSRDIINEWFNELVENGIEKIPPSLIFNIDEIGFGSSDSQKSHYKKVIVPTDIETEVIYSTPRESNHITMINCISCDGGLLKPAFIGINKNLCPDSQKTTHYNNISYYHSKTAFINTMIYQNFIEETLIPYIEKTRQEMAKPNELAALIVDGHLSHVTEMIKSICAINNIILFVIPPHTSHILQPLDLCFFSMIKTNYRSSKRDYGYSVFTNKIEHIYISLQKAHVTHYILSSWKKAGIVPILEFGAVNSICIKPSKIFKKVQMLEPIENSTNVDISITNNPFRFERTPSINQGWGLVNRKQMEITKNKRCPLCNSIIRLSKNWKE